MKGAIVIGILVLIVSFVGARWAWEHSAQAAKSERPGELPDMPPTLVVCWGNFDIEGGVAGLYPKQSGDVMAVVAENTNVEKGDVLLQVDDTLARLKVKQAEESAKAAKLQWTEAKLLVKQYELQREQQSSVIDALKHEIKKVEAERDTKLLSLDVGSSYTKTVKEQYKEGLAQLGDKLKAEQAKLKQAELLDANLKIAQAEADWNVKQEVVAEAKEMLKYYQIVAPSKGIALRVSVRKGETLGPNPRTHAIEFMPLTSNNPMIVRAEVLQEWGRFVRVGQTVEIVDDTYNGPKWEGSVKSLSNWYATTRSPVIEPFRYNDVRTLECLITVKEGGEKMFIGQRVRARIKI